MKATLAYIGLGALLLVGGGLYLYTHPGDIASLQKWHRPQYYREAALPWGRVVLTGTIQKGSSLSTDDFLLPFKACSDEAYFLADETGVIEVSSEPLPDGPGCGSVDAHWEDMQVRVSGRLLFPQCAICYEYLLIEDIREAL